MSSSTHLMPKHPHKLHRSLLICSPEAKATGSTMCRLHCLSRITNWKTLHVKSNRRTVVTPTERKNESFTDKQKTPAYFVAFTAAFLLIRCGGKITKCIDPPIWISQKTKSWCCQRDWYGKSMKSSICCALVWWCLAGILCKAPQFLCVCACVYSI